VCANTIGGAGSTAYVRDNDGLMVPTGTSAYGEDKPMTIQHTVVFRLVHGPGSSAEAEFLDTARATLTAIAGVSEFSINQQISPKSELDWQFSMFFADQAAYDAYNVDPAHVRFVETRWRVEVDAFQEYDFVAQ
jgi:hypothetical protein